jgi:hypothetical protein
VVVEGSQPAVSEQRSAALLVIITAIGNQIVVGQAGSRQVLGVVGAEAL